jgi:dTDP-4-dehydrorhamnose 3,5-epimerase
MIEDVIVTRLEIVDTPGGNVMHGMKETSPGFAGFGEAYFSQIDNNAIKAWKRHKKMTLNLMVPVGEIKFVLFDDRDESNVCFQEVIISKNNYCRLTVPPMVWMGFQGLAKEGSMLLNIADIEHDPDEVDRLKIDNLNYDWSINQ